MLIKNLLCSCGNNLLLQMVSICLYQSNIFCSGDLGPLEEVRITNEGQFTALVRCIEENPRLAYLANRIRDVRDKPVLGILYGEPGIGKTTMAIAMGQRAGRTTYLLSTAHLGNGYCRSESRHLCQHMDFLQEQENRSLCIIDDADNIREGTDGHLGAANTLCELISTLDPKIAIIATTNHLEEIPRNLRIRFINQIHVEKLDALRRAIVLEQVLRSNQDIRLSEGCTQAYIASLAQRMDTWTQRKITHFADEIDTHMRVELRRHILEVLAREVEAAAGSTEQHGTATQREREALLREQWVPRFRDIVSASSTAERQALLQRYAPDMDFVVTPAMLNEIYESMSRARRVPRTALNSAVSQALWDFCVTFSSTFVTALVIYLTVAFVDAKLLRSSNNKYMHIYPILGILSHSKS